MIFLLLQITHNATEGKIGAANAFSEYVKYLPANIPLPTFWKEDERALLEGTTLEAALDSKLKSLEGEFAHLRETTSTVHWCMQHWWDVETAQLTLDDWKFVDAAYRSRALDLPGTGHSTVPCIDMANHASGSGTNALYETDSEGNAVLMLRDKERIGPGEEVRITYGDEKGACEMLFSYGFINEGTPSAKALFLDLDVPEDDPLKAAKKAAAKSPPGFRLFAVDDGVDWEGPFVWLLCVNEEDGLQFKLMQSTDGKREIKIWWKDQDLEDLSNFREVLSTDVMWDVFRLRATAIVQNRIEQQLIKLKNSEERVGHIQETSSDLESEREGYAMELRDLEETLLLESYEDFEHVKTSLIESPAVQSYLTRFQTAGTPEPEEDFS